MSAIDEIKIKKEEVKTSLDKNSSTLEHIHSTLDSVNSLKNQTKKTDECIGVLEIAKKPEDNITKWKPVQEKEPEKTIEAPKENTTFTKQEREEVIKKHLAERTGLRRKEKKMIKNAEYDSTGGRIKEMTISLAVVGIILVVVLRNFLPNDALFALLIIIGATSFMPMGMIMGWLMFDPVMRCKVLRKMSKRNYGIVQFVGHGGKLFPKIKNFDDSLIWRDKECWVLADSRVYQMTKDGNAINRGKEIDSKNIITYVDTVPVLFLDMHSMAPMRLSNEEDTAVYPVEIGSNLKAWVDNQRAKMLAVKKMEDMMMMILIGSCVAAAILALITMTKVEEMGETIGSLQEQLQFIIEGLQQNPP